MLEKQRPKVVFGNIGIIISILTLFSARVIYPLMLALLIAFAILGNQLDENKTPAQISILFFALLVAWWILSELGQSLG